LIECITSLAVKFISLPSPNILIAVCKSHPTLALLKIEVVLSLVELPRKVSIDTLPVLKTLHKGTLKGVAIGIHVYSMTMLLTVLPLSSVASSIHKFIDSFSIEAPILPIALIIFCLHPSLKELVRFP